MGVRQWAKSRMALYSPPKFRDENAYAEFFDWRCDTFAGEDMMTLEYPDQETQSKIFRHVLAPLDLSDRTILDVGCGLGYLKGHLDEHHPELRSYLGIDRSARMAEGARERWGDHFRQQDLTSEPFPPGAFDYVTLISVLGAKVTDDPWSYMTGLLAELFEISRVGVAFTQLGPGRRERDLRSDFLTPPDEMARWCAEALSPHVVVDDTLGLVTYSVFVSKEPLTGTMEAEQERGAPSS